MRLRAAVANGLWLGSAARSARGFRTGLDRVADVQRAMVADVAAFRARHRIQSWDERKTGFSPSLKVERWLTTSGSSGAKKRIPYTRELRKQFDAAIAPWIVNLWTTEPRAFAGEAYWSISPDSESDEEVLGPIQRRLVRAVQAVPPNVRLTRERFREETLRHLVACRTLSLISVWHPSFLDLLVGDLDTEKTWPQLRVISCWADANAAAPAAALAKKFPHARIQPKGLLSTEGFVSIPYDGERVLAYRSHFYEFRDGDEVRLAHELEVGKRYEVVITTGGGLTRYATEDIVEVTGHMRQAPLLRFVGRANHVSDHFGEKLHEIFVRERLERALRDVPHAFAMLACDGDAYVLYLESDVDIDLATLESMLRESHHYDLARRLGQLQPLRLQRVHHGAATYLRVKSATQALGDIKIPALDREQGWGPRFAHQWSGGL
ncbi:MAG TPA: GH3 auxin-responsive promoter family protein [Thermoanaerobaculia bacterium]|nr:GH3 auxin-responsive promoter family protein [Thermoanaerobaculia bacterium]